MTIEVPQEFIDQLNSAVDSEGIRLPFTAPIIWWKHGSKQMKDLGDVRYYGGWGTNAEEFFAAVGEYGSQPSTFNAATFSGHEGEYEVYQSRGVLVAPIATRKRWIQNNGSKGRSHLQMLCMMGSKTDNGIQSWGPVVLSAKGLTTREIENAMRKFETATAEVRRDFAPGVPTLYFWRAIGTFGKAAYTTAGSGNASATVTYPTLYMPTEINEGHLKAWFVGNDTAGEMVQFRNDAAEWINDKQWKQGKDSLDAETAVDPNLAGGYMNNDDIPF